MRFVVQVQVEEAPPDAPYRVRTGCRTCAPL